LPSTPSSHRTSHSAESDAAGQYSLFQPGTARSGRQSEAGQRSAQLEEHRVEQRRRIPRQLDRRNVSSQSESAEIQNPGQRVGGNRVRTRRAGVSASSWQSLPKKLPQPQPAEQKRPDDDAGSVDDLRFLRLPDVKALTGLSKTSLYTMIRDGSFPAPVRLGPRAVAWVRSEVRRWAVERVHASRSAA
jgi:predicted DNA-binding transcriptional regulator AlpA